VHGSTRSPIAGSSSHLHTPPMSTVTLAQARLAKAQVASAFRSIGTVVGVGITQVGEDFAVKVNLLEAPAPDRALPTTLGGVPVRVEVVGPLRKR